MQSIFYSLIAIRKENSAELLPPPQNIVSENFFCKLVQSVIHHYKKNDLEENSKELFPPPRKVSKIKGHALFFQDECFPGKLHGVVSNPRSFVSKFFFILKIF